MASGDSESDVAAGLSELECKLRDLERAFSTLGHEYDGRPVEPPPSDHLAPPPAAEPPPASQPAAPAPDDRLEELRRSQERLSATVETLMADVSKLVDGLAKPPPAAPPPAPPPVAPPPPPLAVAPPPPPPPAPLPPLPLKPPEEPTPAPEPRSIRDYVPKPPATRPPADDGA